MQDNNSKSSMRVVLIALLCCGLPLLLVGLFATGSIQLGSSTTTNNANTTNIPQNSPVNLDSTIRIGDPFPDFNLTEVDGKTITNSSLKGKPAIIWFTTSWCVPCQVGARIVAPLDKELGDNAFNVLVIFVDPKEKDADLINWRKQFANPDWMVAFDNELTNLAKRVNLKFLDSKFLLDKNGVIKNIDFKIADESYLNTIREAVKENL